MVNAISVLSSLTTRRRRDHECNTRLEATNIGQGKQLAAVKFHGDGNIDDNTSMVETSGLKAKRYLEPNIIYRGSIRDVTN